jgi:hypothetical protein
VREPEALLDAGAAFWAGRISAGRLCGSPGGSATDSRWNTRWRGWTCCCTGSAGACGSPARQATERDEAAITAWQEVARHDGPIR